MADSRIKLITEQEIKDITGLTANVDSKKFMNRVHIAQDKYIKPIVGTSCYSDLLTQYDADTLTAANETLLNDYLKYVLAWYVLYSAYPYLHITITPTGVHKKSGEEYQSINSTELEMLRNDALANAEYYTDQAICFIKDNVSDYPCYNTNDCCNHLISDGYNNSGISLDEPVDESEIILTKRDLQ